MAPIETLSHTADLRLRVSAQSLRELFREALRGMTEASGPVWAAETVVERTVAVSSSDRGALLVDFLSEALRLGDTNNEAYADIALDEFTETSLRGRLIGRPVKRLSLEIKAATYHELDIRETKDGWRTNLVFDV